MGFLIGGLIGANIAIGVPNIVLKKGFGAFLMVIGAYTVFAK